MAAINEYEQLATERVVLEFVLHQGARPSAHEAVQIGQISVPFRYFALLHWAVVAMPL
jgi:hypothetical protein